MSCINKSIRGASAVFVLVITINSQDLSAMDFITAVTSGGREQASAVEKNIYPIEPAVITIKGQLISASGETPDGEIITFPAIRLVNPISVQREGDNGAVSDITLMSLVLDAKTRQAFDALKGKSVLVRGTLFHRDNGNQRTDVLITPIEITHASE